MNNLHNVFDTLEEIYFSDGGLNGDEKTKD